jgi:general secretion pathway protein D
MSSRHARPVLLAAALLATALLGGCAANLRHAEGMRLLNDGQREAALAKLREASLLDPGNTEYRVDMLKESQAYGRDLVAQADRARQTGQSGEAAALYAKAMLADPANERARRGQAAVELDSRIATLLGEAGRLLQGNQLAAAEEQASAALRLNPMDASAKRAMNRIRERIEEAEAALAAKAAAQSVMRQPVTLQFRDANLRMVFEALSRATGLNVILDREVRADLKTTIFVKDAAVEDTVDLILLQNQLEKRTLNANTLLIYPATQAKQREYQDLQVRTFQVANVDVKYLQAMLKSVLKVKDLSIDERAGTLVMRDTPDAIAVAAKVIAAHDVPEPEVMFEVEVLEVSRTRLSNLGLKFPEALSISVPDGTGTLGALRNVGRDDLKVSSLSLGVNLKLEDSDSNLLASPRIRARNKEKARILIGDRVPIITNTVTPVQGGGGVVTGSVQYQEVGLKLEVEPQVFSDEEVGIRISLEVSNIVKEIPGPNGSLAYQIGTRTAQTVLRLREGETQILGGLISSDDRNTSSRIPGLGHLPVVGKLFGNNNGTDAKTEIVLSITPHILRPPAVLDPSVRTVFSGTDGALRERALQLQPMGNANTASVKVDAGASGGSASGGSAPDGRTLSTRSQPRQPQRLPGPSRDRPAAAAPDRPNADGPPLSPPRPQPPAAPAKEPQ